MRDFAITSEARRPRRTYRSCTLSPTRPKLVRIGARRIAVREAEGERIARRRGRPRVDYR